ASAIDTEKHIRYPDVLSYLEYVHNCYPDAASCFEYAPNRRVSFCPSDIESDDEEAYEEQNEIIMAKDFVCKDFEEIDAMIDEDVIAAIGRVLSVGITLSLKSQHFVQGQEVPKLDPNLPEQLLQELRDIAFKDDLVEKFREGLNPK
ncbi:ubiquitin carboxyl-terminal hydrolase family protein, partial [Trifolium medium]|nr:ubiquitin carboxyl-terminal hydrolase family protein [Trifolium medium]